MMHNLGVFAGYVKFFWGFATLIIENKILSIGLQA